MASAAAKQIVFAVPPLTFNRHAALGYTGLSEKLFSALEKNGSLTPRAIGRNGERMYLREHLEAVTHNLYGAGATDIDDEFENVSG